MSLPIGAISSIQSTGATNPVSNPSVGKSLAPPQGKGGDFGSFMKGFIDEANTNVNTAETKVQDLIENKTDNIQDVVMSMAKADLSFRMILEMRNKLMDAYQEIMRMQV